MVTEAEIHYTAKILSK